MKPIRNELFFQHLEQILQSGSAVKIRIQGESMYPLLKSEKSCVLLLPIHWGKKVSVGEIVLAHCGTEWVLHRVIRATTRTVTLRGDNCTTIERIPWSGLVGRVSVIYFSEDHRARNNDWWVRLYATMQILFHPFLLRIGRRLYAKEQKKSAING